MFLLKIRVNILLFLDFEGVVLGSVGAEALDVVQLEAESFTSTAS
jgi:hypothetical protein